MTVGGHATRSPAHPRLDADASRVLAQLFVPGHYLRGGREGRASGVVERILALDDDEVTATLVELLQRFGERHRDLAETLLQNAGRIRNRLAPGTALSDERWLLLGATFTHEYALEAAAVCNPSAVALPDQAGVPAGALRFVMSVRQIGEGHRSSIGFRTGVVGPLGGITIDDRSPYATAAAIESGPLQASSFRGLSQRRHDDNEATAWVLDGLGERFTIDELEARLSQLDAQRDTRRNVSRTVGRLRELAARTYTASFPATSELAERVLSPATAVESNGLEDARFVRFVDDDGTVTYYATYTAYDGRDIAQQLLATTDFLRFTSSPLLGAAAANKGMALFPRRIGGRYAALSRRDGASNAIAFADDIRRWSAATPLVAPPLPWEALQVGNCGPPIETEEGWLVLTHGVGPMRTYSIGAWLLDLDDPTKILGRLREPLLRPLPAEQDGYVPNVVYSCGSLLHGSTLVIPYGIGDAAIGFATASLPDVLSAMSSDAAAEPAPF